MGRRASRALWVVSALLAAATMVVALVDFRREPDLTISADLVATISKARTYYDFEHYNRAVMTYRDAIAAGMDDPHEWFRYAQALELSGNPDPGVLFQTYTRLVFANPRHVDTVAAGRALRSYAEAFDYEELASGSSSVGTLVVIDGTVSLVVLGTVRSQADTLSVETKRDPWIGHLGDRVVVRMPHHRRYHNGDTVRVVARYDGRCALEGGAGGALYPCFTAAGPVQDE